VSFDIFLARFERGELADAPREPVLAALRGHPYTGPDQFGFYVVDLPDGNSVEFSARGLESKERFQKCVFHVRRFGLGLPEFLFDIAKAGGFAVVPAMDGNPLFLVEKNMLADLPADMLQDLRPAFVTSATAMADGLSGGFTAWAEYRDHVVGRMASSQEGRGGPTKR
jgi:hypothetical protein